MKVLGVLNQKGGVGKITIATCLSVAFEEDNKKVAIIDLDPQATACFWSDTRVNRYSCYNIYSNSTIKIND
ncbi:MAG: AAA family ATPase [Rickettsiaceae bacterium]